MSTHTARSLTELTDGQLNAISVIERVGSVFSLLGCVFIIVSFCCSKAFHKPINRLVFYASFGNMMTNVGTLMAREYISMPSSVGCQLQAFLIQMFMPADAFWTLAMAINVWLTFYHKFDAERLRKMEIPYLICCYGIPFVPAFTYIFVKDSEGFRVYGNASLWCWVTPQWDIWRILTFYGPVWIVILVTFFIYIRAGREIYQKRKQLHHFSSTNEPEPLSTFDGSLKTTEVFVTSEVVDSPRGPAPFGAPMSRRDSEAAANNPRAPNAAYSVTISSSKHNPRESADVGLPIQSNVTIQPSAVPRAPVQRPRRRNQELNNAAWSYTKCAILFFTAILITWIPSSANRVYSVVHPGDISLPLEFMSSFVLPLQGFWNFIIYITTSWKACTTLYRDIRIGRGQPTPNLVTNFRPADTFMRNRNTSQKTYESESMTELANSRPSSNERSRV